MKKFVLLLLLLCSAQLICTAQKLKYKIRMKDDEVGIMTAVRTGKTKQKIELESNISFQKLITIQLHYRMEASYENNVLLLSSTIQQANGKEMANTTTKKTESGYTITTTKGTSTVTEKQILFNLCKLYFEEPKGVKQVWSDTYGEMLAIKAVGPGKYELTLPDGNKNYYSYHKGICTMVETNLPFGKVTFTLTK